MKIYNISKSQLITLWTFGLIAVFASLIELDSYDPSGFATVFLIAIPAILVFYTLGWCAKNKIKFINFINKNAKFCKKCGAKIKNGGSFCQLCGNKLYE